MSLNSVGVYNESAQKIIEIFKASGYNCYYVGGCVRDALLNREVYDFDLATNASPETIKKIFGDFSLDLKGEKFGTIGIISNGKEYETTSFRQENGYGDFRHPQKVEYCAGLTADAYRRDFRCNALYYNADSGIIDPTGGINDVKNKIVCAVGNPEERFLEDALRVLRALRFCSSLGFSLEENTAAALRFCAEKTKRISKERVLGEIKRIIIGDFAFETFKNYNFAAFYALEELQEPYALEGDELFVPLKSAKNDFCLRFALLYKDLPIKKCLNALERLKADNFSKKNILSVLENRNLDFSTEFSLKNALNELGESSVERILEFNVCLSKNLSERNYYCERLSALKKIITEKQVYSLSRLNVNGDDLISIGIKGKKTGETLNLLLKKVMLGEIKNEKDALLCAAKTL